MNNIYNPFASFPNISGRSIGFDEVLKRLADFGDSSVKLPTYPPYNVRKVEDNKYMIEVAIAGFGRQDIQLTLEEGVLTIEGRITTEEDPTDYIFRGIAERAFTRKFTLADTIEVKNAEFFNGLLKIWLERIVPESKKPKKIEVTEGAAVDEKKRVAHDKTQPCCSGNKEKVKERVSL